MVHRFKLIYGFFSTLLFTLFFAVPSYAQLEHELVRRVVVFPIKVEKQFEKAADEAWWQAREELTRSRRFLVASKQFLVKTEVFQARGDLQPADSIILGKLLDAHALITLQLKEKQLIMTVYDGSAGIVLWQKASALHPSLIVEDQLTNLATKLIGTFVAAIPYQGFTVVDSLIGTPVYEEGDVKLAKVDLGITTGAEIGDVVHWVQIRSSAPTSLFQGGSKTTIFAEGKVVQLDQGIATVEISRAKSMKDIREFSLVRLPREADRLAQEFNVSDSPRTSLTPELVAPEGKPMEQVSRERKPLVASLAWISGIVAFLLLAF